MSNATEAGGASVMTCAQALAIAAAAFFVGDPQMTPRILNASAHVSEFVDRGESAVRSALHLPCADIPDQRPVKWAML